MDNCIIVGNLMKEIDEFVYSMKHGPKQIVLTDKGDIDTFLGIKIKHKENGELIEYRSV